eukprot:m.4510 g.4510  ORF g.4510 m.4510 type:complete len:72 (-) comp2240_c0_seq1:1469-1684(-)
MLVKMFRSSRSALLVACAALVVCMVAPSTASSAANNKTLFSFTDLVDIHGNSASLAQYAGNVTLVINVASF